MFYSKAQCQYMTGAMINSCGAEGNNEYLFFQNSGSSFVISPTTVNINYGTGSPAATNFTTTIDPTGNPAFVTNLNNLLAPGCDFSFLNAPNGSTIPANAKFIVNNLAANNAVNYSNWCGKGFGPNVYMIFTSDPDWSLSGLFANNVSGAVAPTNNRYFRTIVNGNTVDYNYLPETTAGNPAGWASNIDGNYATWSSAGGAPTGYANFPSCTPSSIALPIKLTSFQAEINQKQTQLNWQTSSEANFSHFDLLRSADAKGFETIGSIIGKGNETEISNYEFTDTQPLTGLNYYQLKQVDTDGTKTYSKIIAVNFTGENIIKVYPNPSEDFFKIQGLNIDDIYKVSFRNTQGKLLKSISSDFDNISLLGLNAEKLYIEITMQDGSKINQQIIKR